MGRAAAVACFCAVIVSMAGLSEATMARITCHCDTGNVTGLCVSATAVTSAPTKAMQQPLPTAECGMLCATHPTILRRCENAAALHVGDAVCHGFSFEDCALSCSDGCDAGCERHRAEMQCSGLLLGGAN